MRKVLLLISTFYSLYSSGQVNLPTGSATFSLPIFSWSDSKSRLSSVIELDYNSGNGLKVNDVASSVGQGWNLLQGGVVSRLQVGEPDDQKAYKYADPEEMEDTKKYPDGFLYTTDNYFQYPGCPVTLTKYPIFEDKNHIYKQHNKVARDREADYFSFSFNGRSGMFALDKTSVDEGNHTCKGVSIGDSKLKIWCGLRDMTGEGIRTTIDIIYIQDQNGLIYKFAEHDETEVLKVQYCNSNLQVTYKQPNLKSGGVYHEFSSSDNSIVHPKIINGWYLVEIKDPLTTNVISFSYDKEDIHADGGTAISYYDQPKNYSIISHLFSYSRTPRISSIVYPDGHQVTFNYGPLRLDMKGAHLLASVDIKYKARSLSKYILNTGYVIKTRFGNPSITSEIECARLYLKSVKKIGVDLKADENPYEFKYFLGSSLGYDFVPPPFFHLKDIWGYYNGDSSKEVNDVSLANDVPLSRLKNTQLKGLCFLRDRVTGIVQNPKDGCAKNGLLRQITYPTGGSLNYDYDQNKTFDGTQNISTGGVHVSKTTVTDGGYSNDCNHPVVTNYNYTLDTANTQSSLSVLESPLNVMSIQSHYAPGKKYFHLLSLGCKYHFQYPGIMSRDQAVSLTKGQQLLVALSTMASIGGTISEIINIIQLCAGATGPGAVILDIITTVINAGLTCFLDPSKDNTMTIYYNSDLRSSNPLPAQFKKLHVVENSGSNGRTVYDFTSPADYAPWVAANPSFSMKQRFPIWAYGLVKKITKYDVSGNPIQQTENIYDPSYLKEDILDKGASLLKCTKCLVTASTSQNSDSWKTAYDPPVATSDVPGGNEAMFVDNYDIYTGRLPLQTSYERVFKPGSSTQYLETVTQYSYNDNFLVSSITTTQSNGDKNYKTIKYENALLTAKNIIATPCETATAYTKNNSSTMFYTGESVTEFTTIANGNIVPLRTLVQRFSTPVVSTAMKFYLGPDNPTNIDYVPAQTFTYDTHSNLSGLADEGNHIVTNIYDHIDKNVTASVINADPVYDKAAYTSFETYESSEPLDLSRSGWTLTGTPALNPSSVTGLSSFILSAGKTLTASLNTLKPYRLSFWATNSSIVVTPGATLIKSAPLLNGFTYYEYNVAQGTSSITVSGNGSIDELRLYPQNARMRTVTYDLVIGKTSECDENNRVTYYEYDELGRLRFIKDESKNIVKMYEYNMKSKATGCPATYHNLAVSQVYTKSCAAGYLGSDTAYIIPDSKYTSSISQEDVDQKVQAELDAMGQNFANANGTCKLLYYNAALPRTFTKEGCGVSYKGTSYSYTVPYGRFTSIISQADADAQALEDMDANGQALANLPGNASCVIDNAAQYIGEENAPTQCQVVSGSNTGHRLILVTDVNPNSATYNQTQWADEGVDQMCTVTCSFTAASGYTVFASNIGSSGTAVSFYIVFYATSGTPNWSVSNQIATINGGCKPSATRTLTLSESGSARIWEVIISNTGTARVRLVSGPTPTATISLTGGSYNL